MLNFVGSIIRHLLTALGGALVGLGVAEADVNQFILASQPVLAGVIMYALGQGLSLVKAKK